MEEKFRMTKFLTNDSGTVSIRAEVLSSGKKVAFGVAGTDLSTMQFDEGVDFDRESDELIEKYRNSEKNMAFEYVPNFGFDEIDTKTQTWFKF